MPKAVVLFDGVRYQDGDQVRNAVKGEEVDLSQDEFDRLSELEAVASPRSKDAKAAKAEADELPESDQPK